MVNAFSFMASQAKKVSMVYFPLVEEHLTGITDYLIVVTHTSDVMVVMLQL
jgi:hypothetical protein